jgi:hypothetical protein
VKQAPPRLQRPERNAWANGHRSVKPATSASTVQAFSAIHSTAPGANRQHTSRCLREPGMSSLAVRLAQIGRRELREVEHDLAWALVAQNAGRPTTSSPRRINWALAFPWLKEIMSESQNHRRCWCGARMCDGGEPDGSPTFEHVVPLPLGGIDDPENLVIACHGCNGRWPPNSLDGPGDRGSYAFNRSDLYRSQSFQWTRDLQL